ncbi:MAG: 30S ribosomal protein S27ae [Candidatus Diapherotrites archaeon]|nr:30S ribosomal protein S27ae [Candidatus Diapherotrites archaeon]
MSEENAKKVKTKKEKKLKSALYEIKGDVAERKTRFCPKCGPGVFMAKHKDRYACGRCGYTETITVQTAKQKQNN